MPYTQIIGLFKYWKRQPPTHELVRNLFILEGDDDGIDPLSVFPDGNIK